VARQRAERRDLMCGIAGMVAAVGAPQPDRERIKAATAALQHRGPDGTGFHFEPAVALGSTRLSIIDLEHGDQPIANEDSSVVTVFNGEIWNHEELRRELERAGHHFRTRADTEVLVHGYEEWGEELPERLNGMFALALWDAARQRVLIARDRVGKKPLYLARTASGLAFGSDARTALLMGGLEPVLERDHVPEFLFQRYVGAPRTLFRGVEKLPPGHLVVYDRTSVRQRCYWQVEPTETEPLDARDLRALLLDSVRRRLMSDVPLGVLLSGGVDSTAVLGLMREAGADPVASFTIGFDDPIYDERPSARLAARRFGTEHHEVLVGRQDFLAALPRLAWYRDEPVAEPSEIPLLLLAELVGRHVKVVLSGDGGDEIFGGYPKYRAERLLRAGGPLAAVALRLVGGAAARRPTHRRLERAIETVAIADPLLRWASWFRSFAPDELDGLLTSDLRAAATPEQLVRPLAALLGPHTHLDAGRQMLIGDLLTYLPDNMLLRSDKVLMGASVEGRMPLLDYRIVERVTNVSASARAGLRGGKRVLQEAVGDLIPAELRRRPKRGFPVPIARFLLDDPRRLLERIVLSDRCLERGLFDPSELAALVDGDARYGQDRELKLFTVAALELWLRTNIDELRLEPPETIEELIAPEGRQHEVRAAQARGG
jgi:asparagine synthase (glutamine-hydrolysing)